MVAVLAAVIIALVTGGASTAKDWFFPPKVTVMGKVLIEGRPAEGVESEA